ncbi:MAG TPA: lysylphosphatidylglycerol synthase transmembrane domain-containing protein [Chthoniobacterales bacterium]|nr:lysylphosphatidylglycerol synthase transmembrane domain-containing protein [Chthoniobacterales bacterium]
MKKVLITVIQLAVTVGLLVWVYHDPKKLSEMRQALAHARLQWLVAGIVAYFIVEAAAAFRWHVLLKVQGIHLPLRRLSGLFLIGMFYNQFLPGGTGGDIIKSYLLLKETDRKAGALLAVVFDRFIGLVALVVITVTLVSMRFDLLSQTHETRRYLWILIILLGVSVSSLIISFLVSGFNLFHWLPHRFPGREKLIEIAAAYHLYARHWVASLVAFLASLVAHLCTFTTFLCAAFALRADVVVTNFFAVMPIERTISALPISFAGVGIREKVLQTMLHQVCGVPEGVAILIGSLSFLMMVVCCLPGGIVYFFYRPSGAEGRVRIREMQREVATMEHEISESQ